MKTLLKIKKLNQAGIDHIIGAFAFVAIMGIIGTGYVVVHGHRTAGTAHADFEDWSYCAFPSGHETCLNAWGGGPWVKTYNTGQAWPNEAFGVVAVGGGNVALEFAHNWAGNPGLPNAGKCIGDANNDPNNATAYLVKCPPGTSAGWGTNMKYYYCTVKGQGSGYYFTDNHWHNDYLGPIATANGSYFGLTNTAPSCFVQEVETLY